MKVLSQGSFCAFGFRITFLFVTLHVSKTKRASYQFSQMKGLGTGGHCKLQALVYYILPSRRKVPESDARSVGLIPTPLKQL